MISLGAVTTSDDLEDVTSATWHNYDFLSPTDRIAIIAGCALFFVLVVLIMMCKLWPGCFLYKHCPLKAKYDKPEKERVVVIPKAEHGGTMLQEMSETLWLSLQRTQSKGIVDKEPASPQSPHEDGTSTSSGPEDPGTLKCDILYDVDTETLSIERIRICQLTGIRVPKTCNPCVKVYLNRNKMKAHKRTEFNAESEFVFHTECVKNTHSPKFESTFDASIKPKAVKKYVMNFLIFDCDRYSHIELVGEVVVSLKRLQPGETLKVAEDVKEPQQESMGEVLLSLNYLPTAEKLTCTVLKLQNLKIPPEDMHDLSFYAKVSLQYEKKTLAKHRTSTRHGEACPTFNETLTYDVPSESLGATVMVFELLHIDKEHKSNRTAVIGKVYLGSQCEDIGQRHWIEMMQSPRKAVAYWHELK